VAGDVAGVILAKIKAGVLPPPVNRSGRSRIGKGINTICDGCDALITEEDVEYDVDVTGSRTLRFHVACFIVWLAAVNR